MTKEKLFIQFVSSFMKTQPKFMLMWNNSVFPYNKVCYALPFFRSFFIRIPNEFSCFRLKVKNNNLYIFYTAEIPFFFQKKSITKINIVHVTIFLKINK